jgi:HD-GYP domain-containing protein (c-di-GMP phosphodiesterase class II)
MTSNKDDKIPLGSQSAEISLNRLLSQVATGVKKFSENLGGQVKRLTEIGLALSAEKNLDKLLEMILDEARLFTNADAGTLYIKEGNKLNFKIIQNDSIKIRMGGTSNQAITFPPVELQMSNVSAYVVIKDKSVNIPDVYNSDLFDFTGPKEFDNRTKYRTKSMLVIPMKNHENDVIGVLQLINAKDIQTGDVISFSESFEELTHSLASQAAIAITNVKLIQDMENLFNSFVKVMATAIDEKSPVTAGHIRRVAELTCKMANTITEKKEGPFANVYFDKDQLNELKIAGWMHDIGKVATPVQIIEKGKKLESIFDRVNYIALRFHYITKTVEVEAYKKKVELLEQKAPKEEIDNLERETEKKLQEIEESTNLVMICNEPGEYLEDEKIEKLGKLAKMTYKEGEKQLPLLSEDELLNLSIRKGSITEAERQKMQDHAAISLKMLEQIPFTKKLKNIPLFAGAHHEYLNGKGYPKGLKGDEIPLEGRILAVVDVAEALSAQDRPYKKAMPMEQVYKILGFMVKDGELDPQVVDLIIKEKVLERYLEGNKKTPKN